MQPTYRGNGIPERTGSLFLRWTSRRTAVSPDRNRLMAWNRSRTWRAWPRWQQAPKSKKNSPDRSRGRRAGATHPGGVATIITAGCDRRSSNVAWAMSIERTITYIDGYNLYHGMRDARLQSSRWLDLAALAESLLKPQQRLELVRYFTTMVRGNPPKAMRQAAFVQALHARGGIEIDFGHFLSKTMKCPNCGNEWAKHEEKKTDVNIAVRILDDAYDNRFDVAMVVSGDSDLVPAIESIHTRFPKKRIIVAFPPRRHSTELQLVANESFTIGKGKIRSNRLPDPVITPEGIQLQAPAGWLPASQ